MNLPCVLLSLSDFVWRRSFVTQTMIIFLKQYKCFNQRWKNVGNINVWGLPIIEKACLQKKVTNTVQSLIFCRYGAKRHLSFIESLTFVRRITNKVPISLVSLRLTRLTKFQSGFNPVGQKYKVFSIQHPFGTWEHKPSCCCSMRTI